MNGSSGRKLKVEETANRPGLCSLRLLDSQGAEVTDTPAVGITFNPCELMNVLKTKAHGTEKNSVDADHSGNEKRAA